METMSMSKMSDFKIIKKIGEGSFGKVFKVKRISDNETYAIKTINLSKLDYEGKQNTLNEVRILCSLNHEFIVAYKETFVEKQGKELCIVMEFVGGGDISSKIENCKYKRMYFDEEMIWKYLCQILLGLKKLHDNKIIHRDIKSANLFLSKDFEQIKLGDLNVAKVAKRDFAKTQIGTPYYLAPEIWGNKVYDYRCDIFSLGVVIYEMAALRLPFNGQSLQELSRKVQTGIIKRIPSKFSDSLYQMIKLMLTNNYRMRPKVDELLKKPIIKQYLRKFNLINFQKEKQNLDKLMNTIVLPNNLGQLKNRLPKKKKYQAQSCQELDENQLNKLNPNNIDQILNYHKQRVNKNLPPVKQKTPLQQINFQKKNKPKKFKIKNGNADRYRQYLAKINGNGNNNQYDKYLQILNKKKKRNSSANRRPYYQLIINVNR